MESEKENHRSLPPAYTAQLPQRSTHHNANNNNEKEAQPSDPETSQTTTTTSQPPTDSQPDTRCPSPAPPQQQQRIYQTYLQDAKHFSTSLWSLPPAPPPTHTRTTFPLHPPQALQVALERLPPPVSSRLHPGGVLLRAKKGLKRRRCCLISTGMVILGLGMFVAMIVVVEWSTRPGPRGKVEVR
ncbi:MAG: hypothetical protein Q9195_003648 [Heterodermia aff. obscurata]